LLKVLLGAGIDAKHTQENNVVEDGVAENAAAACDRSIVPPCGLNPERRLGPVRLRGPATSCTALPLVAFSCYFVP
jgi:hypothetical protein